ncbi:uncharacterized protein LOC101452017 [Ceratitis capitata]|uniref:(Mediterranean fruit fly) hypothetical protein n=2 Tax=Ceratitis capitata TaxID=7213 RepID=A0A811UID3_CERCA|nr:uncharacterized protein LOC101452017 [Ceratitis capitata]CAD6997716.1 unnamed protein product [Ceratitis capitata]
MVKSKIFTFLSLYLTLQLTCAFPYQNSLNAIDSNDVKSKELQHSSTSNDDFHHLLQPLTASTLKIIEDHSSTLILETATFLDNVIVELNLLPESNEYIDKLIPELTSLLDRMEKLDLDDKSAPSLHEKAAILHAIARVFTDFDNIVRNNSDESSDSSDSSDSSETAGLKQVLEKLELNGLNERIGISTAKAVQRFTDVMEPFWNSLSEEQKKQHEDLVQWHEHFVAAETDQDKLRTLIEFMTILRNIYLTAAN